MGETAGWRWGNVPLPEPHLVGLGAGILLQVVAAWRLPAVLLWTHVVVIREERFLERRFGAAYRTYAGAVRRYL